MASKRGLRRKMCNGKTKFLGRAAALQELRELTNNHAVTGHMSAYHCRFCGYYHLGHMPTGILHIMQERQERSI